MLGVSDREMDCSRIVIQAVPVTTAQSVLVVAFDTVVVGLTFYKTYQLVRDARSAGVRSGLGEVILRDGELECLLQLSSSADQRSQASCISGERSLVSCVLSPTSRRAVVWRC